MHPSVFVLLSCLTCIAAVSGCATAPTPSQEAVAASSLRVATVAYVTRGKTAEDQAQRADQVLRMGAVVRNYVTEQGQIVVNLDRAAAVVNDRILASDLSEADRRLAQAIVIEAIFLAKDQAAIEGADIGQANARLLLAMVAEIERAARVFTPA